MLRSLTDTFDKMSATNDRPYSLNLAFSFPGAKVGLNDSTVKSYIKAFTAAINQFSTSDQMAVIVSVESTGKDIEDMQKQLEAKQAELQQIVARAEELDTFGDKFLDKSRELYEESTKIADAAKEQTNVEAKKKLKAIKAEAPAATTESK